jgi:peptidyl-prolyl cis-trans isomerase D
MMKSVRSVTTKVAAVIFGALMLLFVLQLSGIFDTNSAGPLSSTSVGKINGQPVDARAYQAAVQQTIDNQQRQTPGRLGLEQTEQIRNEVWDQFVDRAVMESQYKKYGITVDQAEIVNAMRTQPIQDLVRSQEFQTDGQFDLAKYQRWLASAGAAPYLDLLANQYRDEIRRSKLLQSVTADVYVSDPALWQQYRDANEQVTISLTAILPRNAVADSQVTVTPAEVAEYYKNHREAFDRPKTAFVTYVSLPSFPDASDSAAALARAQQVRAEIAAGSPFAEVAKRESSDSVSAKDGGDLPEWKKGEMDAAFDAAAFSLPLNALSQPVLSQFGYHIIQMSSRAGDKAKGRHILIPVEISGTHRDRLEAQADSLDRLADQKVSPEAFADLAKAMGLTVRSTSIQQGTQVLDGNIVVPDGGVWAFQAATGTASPVIETGFAFYLFRLDSLVKGGVPELADIRGSVESAVRDEKKVVKARELAQAYVARLEKGESLPTAAKAMGFPNREFGPFRRVQPPLQSGEVVGTAFALKPGAHSGVLETPQGMYVIQTIAIIPADSAAFLKDQEKLRTDAIRRARQNRVRNYLQALKDAAKIVDNRAEIYQRSQAQAQQATS